MTEPPKVENEEVSHGFMDSLLYVMIPSLLSFFALFWAFYALHSYTVDTKVVSQLYQRMKESRNSIRQKFTNSGLGSNRGIHEPAQWPVGTNGQCPWSVGTVGLSDTPELNQSIKS